MDMDSKLSSNPENFCIGENGTEQYFLPGGTYEGIDSVSGGQEICNFDNSDEDIAQFFLSKPIKIENKTPDITHCINMSDPVIIMPDSDLLLEQVEIKHELPELEDPLGSVLEKNVSDDVIVEHMDIRSAINVLRAQLEKKTSFNLTDYQFWLQDAQLLEPDKNLVDQCVQGEGLVQINCIIKPEAAPGKVIIMDVLKPSEKYTQALEETTPKPEPDNNVVRWIVDPNFRNDTRRLNMPKDPNKWSVAHVRLWFTWAVRQFNVTGVKLNDWTINGKDLCNMTLQSFQEKVPKDPDDIFWTHLELLRKCHVVAVKQEGLDFLQTTVEDSVNEENITGTETEIIAATDPLDISPTGSQSKSTNSKKKTKKVSRILGSTDVTDIRHSSGNRTGNNGQIQLWQFLLELLTDKNYLQIIQWISDDGQFRLINPDIVAQLWGARKNKPTMNYEKLSRALRYYYDGDMIAKVPGKRFVYKFVCDLKEVIGYSASELHRFVVECAVKSGISTVSADFYEHRV